MAAVFQNFYNKVRLSFKIPLIGFLVLLLFIPKTMIGGLVRERERNKDEAWSTVALQWGGDQMLTNPILKVPYAYLNEEYRIYYYLQPETLNIDVSADVSTRRRGAFDVPLYVADITMKGEFPEWKSDDGRFPVWDEATLQMSVLSNKKVGLTEKPIFAWNGESTMQTVIKKQNDNYNNEGGVRVETRLPKTAKTGKLFSVNLKLDGVKGLGVLPLADSTSVNMASEWPAPKFVGADLPVQRELSEKGFSAQWKRSSFLEPSANKNPFDDQSFSYYGQQSNLIGTEFILPVDTYRQTDRAVKYAMLFVLLTFIGYFMAEIFLAVRIHPIQYLLTGFAVVLFYMLLLAISEYISFGPAYLVAAVATALLVSGYTSAFMPKKTTAFAWCAGLLGLLHGYFYLLLTLENSSLIAGSIGLFILLAAIMFLTRRVNWYELGK